MFFLLFVPVGYKIFPIKCNFKNVKFILASKEKYDPRHFTVLNLQSSFSAGNTASRHPCSLARACDACLAPYGEGTSLRSLGGADGSPVCGLPSCKHYGLFYSRLPYLVEDGETEPASFSVKLQSVLYYADGQLKTEVSSQC